MLPGQTAWKNGYQCMLFPLAYINNTQEYGPGTYSHCCNMATDWAAPGDIIGYEYYAPCDCYMLRPAYGSDNICAYRSAREVLTPSGVRYVSFLFMHDNTPPAYQAGQLIRQGQIIGRTGNAGIGTGPHVHIDQAAGQSIDLYDSGQSCAIGINCFKPYNELAPTNVFYITGDEQIITTGSLIFQRVDGTIPGSGPFPLWMASRILRRKKNGYF